MGVGGGGDGGGITEVLKLCPIGLGSVSKENL